jgi:endonuclease/exonuclease/phosphatase family metal-dependent hydrolase
MKNIIAFILITVIFTAYQCTETNDENIIILSYNVRNCTGMDGATDYKRVADVIKQTGANIVALQELDSAAQRSMGVVVLDTLAKLTGMNQVYGASISFQGGKYGIGILAEDEPVRWKRIPLPGREEQRSLLVVEFSKYILACTHFSLNADDRLTSAEIINETLNEKNKPVFLAGDFNAIPASPVIEKLSEKWIIFNDTSVYTAPSDNPRYCIDYIMGLHSEKYRMKAIKAVVGKDLASDHLPVWIHLKIEMKKLTRRPEHGSE